MDFEEEIDTLSSLAFALRRSENLREKQECLLSCHRVTRALDSFILKKILPHACDLPSKIALFSIAAIGQHEILFASPNKKFPKEKICALLGILVSINSFYESLGGIVGYQLQALKLLAQTAGNHLYEKPISRAPGYNHCIPSRETDTAILSGLEGLDQLAEIYPIGGLGSRLNLVGKKMEPLPVAYLPFCGRTLLETLVRDLQAREFLYYRLYKRQITVPIAMMTSLEKENAQKVQFICEKKGWFDRPRESFFLFSQISVPVITEEGKWCMKAPFEPQLQPGGHGALWKAAEENGLFCWLEKQQKIHLLIRQINNPIAGLDFGLLALMGTGIREKKAFGFASCERLPQTAEGILVLIEEQGKKRLSNIEYTDFRKYGIEDKAIAGKYSLYPANTNILYANLQQILPVIKKNPLPGLILNMKNKEISQCPKGTAKEVLAGRLESMMQNLSDAMYADTMQTLPTFLTYNERKKTISAAKISFEAGKKMIETPEGAFYDLLENSHSLLRICGASVPPFCSQEQYLAEGPSLLFIYHPALGPLYSLIAQKIIRGIYAEKSELQLEIADVLLENLELDGSLCIQASHLLGHNSQGIIRYSNQTGKCILKNVKVKNKGINRKATTDYWKNQIKRRQCFKIILQGHSEFYAENVTFIGDRTFVVPEGQRWIVFQNQDGNIQCKVEKPNWKWEYRLEKKEIKLARDIEFS